MMEIRAGGQKWRVEARETKGAGEDVQASWEVRFEHGEREGERVEMRWIPCPERLTEGVARKLFELAGERLWRDRRTGMIYRIQLVDEGGPGDDLDLSAGTMLARLRTSIGTTTVPYEVGRPLGLATDAELEALADLAFARFEGAPA
jgi:hypothetical protein